MYEKEMNSDKILYVILFCFNVMAQHKNGKTNYYADT